MGLIVSELRQTPVGEQELEIVERKGLGHPDHICDAVMNEVSISLSREYIKRYGIVMHHNIDKLIPTSPTNALRTNTTGTRRGSGSTRRSSKTRDFTVLRFLPEEMMYQTLCI